MARRNLVQMWLAELRQASIDIRRDPTFSQDSSYSIFLSPHYDDICFSLGAFVYGLQAGILLNIFSKSGHVAHLDMATRELLAKRERAQREAQASGQAASAEVLEDWVNWVSGLRRTEDLAFAERCRLKVVELGLPEAPLRGQDPFKGQITDKERLEVETSLMNAFAGLALPPTHGARPWLFCPAGIGGHVDHLIVRNAILKNLKTLQQNYRIAFYEDLHYASDRAKRSRDLPAFLEAASALELSRIKLPMHERANIKLELVHLYTSQLVAEDHVISRFSPASLPRSGLHEAVWVPRSSEPAPGEGTS